MTSFMTIVGSNEDVLRGDEGIKVSWLWGEAGPCVGLNIGSIRHTSSRLSVMLGTFVEVHVHNHLIKI